MEIRLSVVSHPNWFCRLLLVTILSIASFSYAAPGDLDPEFSPGTTGVGFNAIRELPDGKLLIWGDFASYNGTARHDLARLNPDGSLDESFDSGTGPSLDRVYAAEVLPDGKLLVGGKFSTFSGAARPLLIRLNPNGTVDQTFDPHIDSEDGAGIINVIRAQSDGKILLAGKMRIRGTSEYHLMLRLNVDGTVDPTFVPGISSSPDGLGISHLEFLPDARILVAGRIRKGTQEAEFKLLRLRPDGSVDSAFQGSPALPANLLPTYLIVQPDGKLFLQGGYGFDVVRHLPDGDVDPSFKPYVSLSLPTLLPDGKLVGESVDKLWRIHANGERDDSFVPPSFWSSSITSVSADSKGRILAGGEFIEVYEAPRKNLVRVLGGEQLTTEPGQFNFVYPSYPVREASGSILVSVVRSGSNLAANSVTYSVTHQSARAGDYVAAAGVLNFAAGESFKTFSVNIVDDSVDETNETLLASLSAPGGNATIGSTGEATITIFDDENPGIFEWRPLAKVTSESAGTVDVQVVRNGETLGSVSVDYATVGQSATPVADYTPVTGTLTFADGENVKTITVPILEDAIKEGPEAIGLQLSNPTGGATLGTGAVTSLIIEDNDMPGAVDPGFVIEPPATGQPGVTTMAELPDGRLLVAENVAGRTLRRLNADGSVDAGFAPNFSSSATVRQIELLSDGRILLLGDLLGSSTGIVRLNSDGSKDSTFNAGYFAGGHVSRICVQPDGRIIVAGSFSFINGGTRTNLARLMPNGAFDPDFTASGAPTGVTALISQPDGKILIGGNFSFYNGNEVHGLVRLHPNGDLDTEFVFRGYSSNVRALALQPDGKILVGGSAPLLTGNTLSDLIWCSLARLLPDGTVDPTFNAGTVPPATPITTTFILVQPDGKIVANCTYDPAGNYDNYSIASRLNPDGSRDSSFEPVGGYHTGRTAFLLRSGDFMFPVTQPGAGTTLVKVFGGDLNVAGAGQLGLTWPSYEVSEATHHLVVHVVRKNGNTGAVSVDYATAEGTAQAGRDYVSQSGTLTFASGEVAKTIEIPLINTVPVDGSRQLTLSLSNPSRATLGTISSTAITIRDDGTPGSFQLQASTFELREGKTISVKVRRALGADGEVSVEYSSVNQTATRGTDYPAVSGTLTFAPGEIEKSFSIEALADQASEGNETLQLKLENATGGAVVGTPSFATVTILDINDAGSLANFQLLGTERFVFAMEKQSDGKVVIGGTFSAFFAKKVVRLNRDGTLDNTFNANVQSGFVSQIVVQADGKILLLGSDLRGPSGELRKILRLNANGTIDQTLAHEVLAQNGNLPSGISAIGAQSDGKIVIAGSFTTLDGTARPYLARLLNNGELDPSFQPTLDHGVTKMLVDRNDCILYAGPNKLVRLQPDGTIDPSFATQLSASANNPIFYPRCLVIDDEGRIMVGGTFNAVNGETRVNVARLLPSGLIDKTFDAGTAFSAGEPDVIELQEDGRIYVGSLYYHASGGVLRVMENGALDSSFRLQPVPPLRWDNPRCMAVVEEYGLLVAGDFTEIDGVSEGYAVRLLIGPRPGKFRLDPAVNIQPSEDSSPITVTVNRVGGSEGPASVSYITRGLDVPSYSYIATPGSDYTAISGTLEFADGEITKTFEVALLDDSKHEELEFFLVDLNSPEGAFLSISRRSLLVGIDDNDPRMPGALQFSAGSATVNETAGVVSLTVERVGGFDGTVSVLCETVPGSALDSYDYTPTLTSLEFHDGVTSRTIEIPIYHHPLAEPDESFSARLFAPELGAVVGTPSTATVTILDDDTKTPNDFRGNFHGLITELTSYVGYVKCTLVARGVVTGVLMLDGKRYPFRGRLDANGFLAAKIPRKGLPPFDLTLVLGVNGEVIGLYGELTTEGRSLTISSGRQTYDAKNTPAPIAGRYALSLKPGPNSALPAGNGYALVNVTKSGGVRVVGSLADGTVFTQSSAVGGDNDWPLFASLYGKKGYLSARMEFDFVQSWVCSGNAFWNKPARPRDVYYPGGFKGTLALQGDLAPPSGFVIPAASSATATLSGGNLTAPLGPLPLQRPKPNQLLGSDGLKLTLNSQTGLLTGQFLNPQIQRRAKLRGIISPNGDFGSGYFLGTDSTGLLELTFTQSSGSN